MIVADNATIISGSNSICRNASITSSNRLNGFFENVAGTWIKYIGTIRIDKIIIPNRPVEYWLQKFAYFSNNYHHQPSSPTASNGGTSYLRIYFCS